MSGWHWGLMNVGCTIRIFISHARSTLDQYLFCESHPSLLSHQNKGNKQDTILQLYPTINIHVITKIRIRYTVFSV